MADKIVQLKDGNGNNLYPVGVGDFNNYSTSEQRIGTWIDGKTLYRKVVDFGTLPNNAVKNVASGVTGMAFLAKMSAIAYNGSGTYLVIPYTHQDQLPLQIQLAYTNNTVQISTGTNRSSYSAYVIMEYTKQ